MQTNHSLPDPEGHKPAFSLVEMLVVIAIMSILMTAGSIGVSSMSGKGVSSGVATAEALFDEARTIAIGRNLRACVLIAKKLDNNSAEELRRILIAVETTDATGLAVAPPTADPQWKLTSRGAVLPDQTFYSATLSQPDPTGTSKISMKDASLIVNSTALRNGSGAAITGTSGYVGEYFYYEFNPQGICKWSAASAPANPSPSFVIGAGGRVLSKHADDSPPFVTSSTKRDFGGFVVWRNGRTSVLRNPDQIATLYPAAGFDSFKNGSTF